MNDTEVAAVRTFAPAGVLRRDSKVFAHAYEMHTSLVEENEKLLQSLTDTRNECEVKRQQIEFLKDEVRRLTTLNDVHAQNRAALEAGLQAVKDMVFAVDLRNKTRTEETTG